MKAVEPPSQHWLRPRTSTLVELFGTSDDNALLRECLSVWSLR
jgi:hypothetical protein